jgi:hypothetical protein
MTAVIFQNLLASAADLVPILQANPIGGVCFVVLVICATFWRGKR